MAGDGASAGEVYVECLPSADNFWSRFESQTRAQASRVGDNLGSAVSKPMSDRISAAIADGINRGSRGAADNAARAGEQAGARFGELFKARVEAALRDLPDAKIGLDEGEVNRDLAVLRAELDKLRGRDLTVRVDVTQAYVDVVTLREELAALGRQRPTVRADVDTTEAMAQTALLIAEVERFGALHPTVRPDVDSGPVNELGNAARKSTGSISLLVAAGFSLGPAIVPAAAAATGAIAALGAAGFGAVAGLGVTALGISGVVGAMKAMSQAEEAASKGGAAASTALNKLNETMASLSPEAQRFATFVYGLKPALLDVRAAAERGVLPGFQSAIESLLPVLPDVISMTGKVASAVGRLAAEAGQAFAQPYWVNFAHFLVNTGVPAMETFARAGYNMALGLSGLVRAGEPLGRDFGAGLLAFSREFARWALTVENTQGYRDFLAYVHTEGPIVAHTIGDVVSAAIRLVQAISPIGGVSLAAIRLLAETINALPVPVLTVLAGSIVAVVTAMKAWQLITQAQNALAPIWRGAVDVVSSAINNARLNMTLAEGQASRFGIALTAAKGAATGAGSAIGALAGSINPVGAALAVAAIGLTIFAQRAAEQKAAIESLKSSMSSYGSVLKDGVTQASLESARAVLTQKTELRGLVDITQSAGISSTELVKGLNGDQAARQRVIDAIQKQINYQQYLATINQDKSAEKKAQDLEKLRIAFSQTNTENAEANRLTKILTDEQRDGTGTTGHLTEAQRALGTALTVLADQTSTAAQKANALKVADDAVFGAARNAVVAEQDQALALIAMTKAGQDNANQNLYGKATLDLHSEAAIRNRQMLEQRFLALGQEYQADVQSGVAVADATAKHDRNAKAIEDAAVAAGFDTGEVHRLAVTFGTLPTNPRVQVTVAGVQEALTELQNLEIAQLALKQGLDPAEATRQWRKSRNSATSLLGAGGLATGGPVFGPGGPTDDMIPAWLSNNEHVWTAAEVEAAGGHAAVEAIRRWVLGGKSPVPRYPGDGSAGIKFAQGGAVTWPFPVTAGVTRIPSLAEVRKAVTFGPDWTGPVGEGLQRAADFVRAQAGKPYIWASAGPEGYDCSGLLSAAWLVAHGRNPYNHIFSTSSEAPFFPVPGFGAFTAGWSNPGDGGPGGGINDVGHTAGKIGNLAFESRGGDGVVVGSGVTPVSAFPHIGHFDQGGWLDPGWTLAYNGTGAPERIRTAEQESALQTRGGDAETHYHLHGGSEAELLALLDARQARQEALARVGRPH